MVQRNPIPISGMVLMAIPDDGAFGPALSVGLVFGRGRILCHTGWRLLWLWATIYRGMARVQARCAELPSTSGSCAYPFLVLSR